MNIGFFAIHLQLGYGVDLTVAEIAKRLSERGHNLTIFTTSYDGTYENYPFAIRKIEIRGGELNRALPIFELNAQRALRKIREELQRMDLLIPATFPFYGIWILARKPTIFLHFGNVPTKGFTWKGKLNWFYLNAMENYIHFARARLIVTISNFLASRLPRKLHDKLRVIYLGGNHYYEMFQLSGRKREEARALARSKWGLREDEIVICSCTRLHKKHAPYKGLKNLIRLYKRLKEKAKVKLVVAGAGSAEDEAWLRSEGILALANLKPEEMADFYLSGDIYATMSEWEGLNLPVLEASWFGLPSVALNVAAHPEIPVSILVKDEEEFLQALLRLTKDEVLREELGASSERLARKFDWQRTTEEFEEAIAELGK